VIVPRAAGGLIAIVAFAGLASAQPSGGVLRPTPDQIASAPGSSCPAFPTPPRIPNGGSARWRQMQETNAAIGAYDAAFRSALSCRTAEANRLEAQVMALQAQRIARAEEANTATGNYEATCANWNRSVSAFNERNGRSSPELVCTPPE